jgi:anthranilate synthase component 1
MTTAVSPTLEEFLELAKHGNVIPVYTELVADAETPISAFAKIRGSGPSFLFESTEKNDVSGRFSFVGTNPRAVIRNSGERTDPLEQLRKSLARYQIVAGPELSPFCGGAVGVLGYDTIGAFEPKVPALPRGDLGLPEMIFLITGNLVVFDHRLRRLKVIVNAFLEDGPPEKVYADATNAIAALVCALAQPVVLRNISVRDRDVPSPRSNFQRSEFEQIVARAKAYIEAGDIFQVVLSQRFEADFNGDALDFYRCLRFINPSPYMFCLSFGEDFALVGSSPEMHVRLQDKLIQIRPIAGTRPRGSTPIEDEKNAADLLADPKERAEHIMLVDLARNDVGRVAETGSVRVTELTSIERYSHVMHIVSHVTGRLRTGCDGFDVLKATFPAGTVSGAPKIRAMQIISELEKNRRGCYAGAVGYVGFDGNVDSCIVLRSAVLKNGKAYFQAGAGIVADSDPQREYEESVSKARAMMHALALAAN